MPDDSSKGCPDDAAGRMDTHRIAALVDRLLIRAGASKALRDKVRVAVGELKSVTGQVSAVQTTPGGSSVFVSEVRGGNMVRLDFPPNDKGLEAELLRAQDAGRIVSVMFRSDPRGRSIVDEVYVYAGATSPSPRY